MEDLSMPLEKVVENLKDVKSVTSNSFSNMANTVIGGLASSTILTLIVVLIVYEVLSKIFKKNRKEVEEN